MTFAARASGAKRRLNPTARRTPASRTAPAAAALRDRQAERLLDEDVLAGAGRLHDEGGVEVVPRRNEDRRDLRVLENLADVRRRPWDSVAGARHRGGEPRRVATRVHHEPAVPLEVREVNTAEKLPAPITPRRTWPGRDGRSGGYAPCAGTACAAASARP
jgi:hypothetical protein